MSRLGKKTRIVAGAALLGSMLAGCSDIYYDRRDTVSFAAYDATAAAQAVQVIDFWPAESANRAHASNGAVVAGALERYRTCQVVPPKPSVTSANYNNVQPMPQLGCTPPPAAMGPGHK